ncbi:MAG: ribonuclease HII [Desulfotomaculaceae bacterium]|nr:ribonuclease HII [Desulfotomaculaceae bacterium]
MTLTGLSVAQIKELLNSPRADLEELLTAMAEDPRSGVRELCRRLRRAESIKEAENKRLNGMFLYEEELWAKGYTTIAGVDEAGRGPLAGPVVAAAVILLGVTHLKDLNDSKKLTAAKRETLAGQIKEVALVWAIGMSTVEEIYQENIHLAGLTAMRRAVLGLKDKPVFVLVDGFKIPGLNLPQMPLIGGDGLSASIAAASILAKVERDRIMDSYDRRYPQYGFSRHKGYATPEHLSALKLYGPCPIHRAGFQPVKDMMEQADGGVFG